MTMYERISLRQATDVVIDCIVLKRREKAILCDVSPTGCRIELFDGTAQLGAMMVFQIDEALQFAGEVVWVKKGQAGVRFTRPLSAPIMDALGLA